jgi:hypothetical protein
MPVPIDRLGQNKNERTSYFFERKRSHQLPWFVPLVMAMLCQSLTACGRSIDWMQETPLHDGRTITVERHSELGPPFPGSSGMEVGQTLTFQHADTRERITWRMPDGLNPVMIDFDQSVPYYVLKVYTAGDYSKWGCPNPPYLVYRYQQGAWTRLPFEALPTTFVNRNLLPLSKDVQGLKDGQVVSANVMENLWLRVERPKPKQEALKISREKVNPIAEGCNPDFLNKQGRQEEKRIGYPSEVTK